MRLLFLPSVVTAVLMGGYAMAEPLGVQRIGPSSEYERLHDGYAFGQPGPRTAIKGQPAFWVRHDTAPESANAESAHVVRDGAASGTTARSTNKEVDLAAVYFATGSDLPLDVGVLDLLHATPPSEIVVTGRTDSVGSTAYNAVLSKKRAEQVAAYLERMGIERARIRVAAKGKGDPIASNATHDGRARNRQVQVEVKKK